MEEVTQAPSVRYTIEIPREGGMSYVHGSCPVGDYIEIPLSNETD